MSMLDKLKSEGRYFEAGQLAYELGLSNNYGIHYGWWDERNEAIIEFKAGYTFAKHQP